MTAPTFSWLYAGTEGTRCSRCQDPEGPRRSWWTEYDVCASCQYEITWANRETR